MRKAQLRVLLTLLVIATVISSFAVSAYAAPKSDAELKLLDGLDFDILEPGDSDGDGVTDGEGVTDLSNRTHIKDNYGILFSSNNAVIKKFGTDDGRVFIKDASYLNADDNPLLAELFFSKNGPSKFALEMDVAITEDFGGTGEENQKSKMPTSKHRGMSLITIGGSWNLKVTAPGVGKLNLVKEEYTGTTANGSETKSNSKAVSVEAPVANDVGYFYTSTQSAGYWYDENSKVGWAGKGYAVVDADGNIPAEGTYLRGHTSGAITNGAIDNGCTYTLGNEVHIKIEFSRGTEYMFMNIYVDGKLCGTSSYDHTVTSNRNIRITDLAEGSCVTIDDLKVTVTDCGGDHDSWWNTVETRTVVANNGLAFDRVCKFCDGATGEYPNIIKNEANDYNSGGSVGDNGIFTANFGNSPQYYSSLKKSGGTDYWTLLAGTAEEPKAPWWFNFDIKVTGTVSAAEGARKSLVTWMPGTSNTYRQFLNVHKATVDGTAKGRISLFNEKAGEWTLYLENGNNYSFHIMVDPATGYYYVYVTDYANQIYNKYFGCASDAKFKSDCSINQTSYHPSIRFGDGSTGSYILTNLTYTRNMTQDAHEHTAPEYRQNTVSITDTVLEHTVYECYCGVNHVEEISSTVVDPIANLSAGTKTVAYTAPDDEYFVATDLNLKTLSENGALLTFGDTVVLELKDGNLVADKYSVTAESKAYSVAAKIIGNAYTLYLDGVQVDVGNITGDSKVVYGAEALDASFNYNKIVILDVLGEGIAPAIPTVGIDVTNAPCAHSFNTSDSSVVVDYGETLKVVYKCTKCGDRVYETLGEEIPVYTDATLQTERTFPFSNTAHVMVYYDPAQAGANAENYWIDFDFTLSTLVSDTSKYYHNGSGRSVLNFGEDFNSFIRAYPVSRGNRYTIGDGVETTTAQYFSDHIEYCFGNKKNFVYTDIYAGDTVHFSFYVDRTNNVFVAYVDGEFAYKASGYPASGAWNTGKNYFRFGDSVTGDYTVDNFRVRRVDDTHVHTNLYGDDTLSVQSADSWLGLSTYTCYCGEKVVRSGISANKVTATPISDKIEGSAVINLPTLSNYWFSTDIHVTALSDTPLVSVGEKALLSVKEGKLLAYGDVDTQCNIEANYTRQVTMQVVPVDNAVNYDLYIDGKFIGSYSCDFASAKAITLGSDGLEGVNFLYTKVVDLGDYFTAVAPEYTKNYSSDCVHVAAASDNKFILTPGEINTSTRTEGVNKLIFSYICTECGERIYEAQGDVLQFHDPKDNSECAGGFDTVASMGMNIYGNLNDTQDTTLDRINSERNIRTDVASVGSHADPFWISFDIGTLGISESQVKAIAGSGKGNGGSILTIRGKDSNVYVQMLRGYGVLLSAEDEAKAKEGTFTEFVEIEISGTTYRYYNNLLGIRNHQTTRPKTKADESDFVMTLKAGEFHNVAIYVQPSPDANNYYWTSYIDGVRQPIEHNGSQTWFNSLLEHYSFRFLDGNYGDFVINNFALVKAVKGDTKEIELPEGISYGDSVNVFEFSASLDKTTTENAYYPLITFNRDYSSLTPIFVNASTGDLAYRTSYNGYKSLGYTLGSEKADIVVVYDEITGVFRYHLPDSVVDNVAAQHVYFNSMDSASVENITVLDSGMGGLSASVELKNAYAIGTSGTPEVIGFQVMDINGHIRLVSGVNTEYYNEIGGYVELYANGKLVNSAKENSPMVFEGFVAADMQANAKDYGYKYVSLLSIAWNDSTMKFDAETDYYILFRPYSVIEGVEYHGEPVKIDITLNGGNASFAFDTNYSLKLIKDNTDKYTYTMDAFKDAATIEPYSNEKGESYTKAMAPVIDGMGGAHLYLRLSRYEFTVNPESANGAFIVVDTPDEVKINVYLNGSETPIALKAQRGRNYLPLEGLIVGQNNTVKVQQANISNDGKTGTDSRALFNGILLDGDMVAPVTVTE